MPTEFRRGDLFTSGAKMLINPTNCVGVMGAGLARSFRSKFPQHYEAYREYCQKKHPKPGWIFTQACPECNGNPDWVSCLFTKGDWKEPARIEWIRAGLVNLIGDILRFRPDTVAVPALGCGHGGLDWETQVRPLMQTILGKAVIGRTQIWIYEPYTK